MGATFVQRNLLPAEHEFAFRQKSSRELPAMIDSALLLIIQLNLPSMKNSSRENPILVSTCPIMVLEPHDILFFQRFMIYDCL
jgi:hypothetical protein